MIAASLGTPSVELTPLCTILDLLVLQESPSCASAVPVNAAIMTEVFVSALTLFRDCSRHSCATQANFRPCLQKYERVGAMQQLGTAGKACTQ